MIGDLLNTGRALAILGCLVLLSVAPHRAAAEGSVLTSTRIWNGTAATATFYWLSSQCTGVVNNHPKVCYAATLAPGQGARYTWVSGHTNKRVNASCDNNGNSNDATAYAEIEFKGSSQCHPNQSGSGYIDPEVIKAYEAAGPKKKFKLVNKARGMCLDPAETDGASGRGLRLAPCEDQLDQTFYQKFPGDLIQLTKTDRCLDVKGYSGQALGAGMLYACDGYTDQYWTIGTASAWAEVRNSMNSLCLEAEGEDPAQNAAVRLNTCDGKAHQLWMPVYFPIE